MMERILLVFSCIVLIMLCSCAIFINNDDDDSSKNDNGSDTLTVIYSKHSVPVAP